MATHSSILAWEIPRTEDPGWLQSKKSWTQLSTHMHTHTLGSAHLKWAMAILPIIQADDLKTGAYKQDIRLPSLALPASI